MTDCPLGLLSIRPHSRVWPGIIEELCNEIVSLYAPRIEIRTGAPVPRARGATDQKQAKTTNDGLHQTGLIAVWKIHEISADYKSVQNTLY
jgi:hypothetical protein